MHVVNSNIGVQNDTIQLIEKQTNLIKNSIPSPNINKLSAITDNLSGHRSSPIMVGANGNSTSTSTITPMESGAIKITYEKQQTSIAKSSQDDLTGRISWWVQSFVCDYVWKCQKGIRLCERMCMRTCICLQIESYIFDDT